MKSLLGVVILAAFAGFQPLEAQAKDNIRLRAGFSTISGFIGLEYQKNKIAIDVGWLGSNDPGEVASEEVKIDAVQQL